MRLLINLVITLFLCGPHELLASESQGYVRLLGTYLAAISTITASFEQITRDESTSDATSYDGRLWIEKPNRFRVNTRSPSQQTLVSDGTDFWSYDADLEQVVISKLNQDLNQVPILLFSSDIASIEDAYDISGYSDEKAEHFILEPLSDTSLFQSLTLSFQSGNPVSIRINAATGQTTTVLLTDIVLNAELSPDQFIFVATVGADVIDDRK